MQQSSATQSLHLSFWGLRKIVACSHPSSQCLLVSTVFGTVSSLHPTSFLMIFTLVAYIAATHMDPTGCAHVQNSAIMSAKICAVAMNHIAQFSAFTVLGIIMM